MVNRRVLPGYQLSLSFTLLYLGILVLIPLAACLLTASKLSWEQFVAAVWTPRARAAYALTFSAALLAALICVQTFGAGQSLQLDARIPAIAIAAGLYALRVPFIVVVPAAAVVAAVIRLLT